LGTVLLTLIDGVCSFSFLKTKAKIHHIRLRLCTSWWK